MNWLELLFGTGCIDCLTADFGISAILATIGLAITAATAATSAGMAAVSAKDARRKEEKNRAEIEEAHRKRENLLNLRLHQDVTDRTEVQGMLREMREQQDAQRSQDEARGDVLGETSEVRTANAENRNKAMADSIAQIASNSSMLKDGVMDQYMQELGDYSKQKQEHNTTMAQIEMNRSNQWANAAGNAASAAAGSATALAGMLDGGAAKAPAAKVPDAAEQPAKAPQVGWDGKDAWGRFQDEMTGKYHIGKPNEPTYMPWQKQLYPGQRMWTPPTFKR